jgi:hypothetical protein
LDLSWPLFHRVEPVVSLPSPRCPKRTILSSLPLSPSLCASEALLFCGFRCFSFSAFFFSPYAAEVGFRRFGKLCEALDGLSIEPRVANFCLEY